MIYLSNEDTAICNNIHIGGYEESSDSDSELNNMNSTHPNTQMNDIDLVCSHGHTHKKESAVESAKF